MNPSKRISWNPMRMGQGQQLLFLRLLFCSSLVFFTCVKGQQWIADHTFAPNQVAVYPAGSFVTHQTVPVQLNYPAGASVTMQTATQVQFPSATTIYGANGAESYSQFSGIITFPAGKTMALPPGSSMIINNIPSVLRYGRFNGNNAAIVAYANGGRVTFNCPSQPSVFPAGTNPINYYNPGADNGGVTTQFGPSGPLVNSVQTVQVTCTGYTQDGFPIRTFRNALTGEAYNIQQTASNSFNVTFIVASG